MQVSLDYVVFGRIKIVKASCQENAPSLAGRFWLCNESLDLYFLVLLRLRLVELLSKFSEVRRQIPGGWKEVVVLGKDSLHAT